MRRSLGRLSVTPRTCRLRRRACRKRLSRPLSVTSPPCGSCARPSVCAVSLRASLFGTFPDRAAHFLINDSLLRAETEGRIRLLRRCRRACATSPGIGVKPSFYLSHINVVSSRRAFRRSKIVPGRGVKPTERATHSSSFHVVCPTGASKRHRKGL